MCYRSIRIQNPTLHFNKRYSPFYLYCSCGHCLQCKSIRQRDWLIRSFAEWKDACHKGGFGLYYTLTYDDENVPFTFGHYHFSQRHIQLFIKRLRKYWLARGFDVRYIVCSEFGDLFRRPHYHTDLFFVPIDPKAKKPMLVEVRKSIEEKWQYGFVYPGKHLGKIMNTSALRYVTKYVTKDVGFDHKPFLFRVVHQFAISWIEKYGYTHPSIKAWYNEVKLRSKGDYMYDFFVDFHRTYSSFLPFTTSSQNFGISILKSGYLSREKEVVIVPTFQGYKDYPLPLYIRRQLYYDRVPNERDGKCTKYVLNFNGISKCMETIGNKIDTYAFSLAEFFSSYIPTYEDVERINYHYPDYFRNSADLASFLRSSHLSPEYIAIYKYVFRGRSLEWFSSYCFIDGTKDYISIFDNWRKFYERCLTFRGFNFDKPLLDYDSPRLTELESSLFSAHDPLFASCEMYVNIYDIIRDIHKENRSLLIERENKKKREIRQRKKIAEYNLKKLVLL